MCILNVSAFHEPFSGEWGPLELFEMGDPLGWCVGVYVCVLCQGHWGRGRFGGIVLFLYISDCIPCVFNVVKIFSLYVLKHGYSPIFSLLMSTIWQSFPHYLNSLHSHTKHAKWWDNRVRLSYYVNSAYADIKSHYYEAKGREPGPLWAPDGPNDLKMGWHV